MPASSEVGLSGEGGELRGEALVDSAKHGSVAEHFADELQHVTHPVGRGGRRKDERNEVEEEEEG